MANFDRHFGEDVQAAKLAVDKIKDVWEGGFARHHVVPVEVANNSNFIRTVYGISEYQERFNSLDNVILLPVDESDAAGLGMSQHCPSAYKVGRQSGLRTGGSGSFV